MNLNELSKEIFLNNKEKGFWDEDRNFGEIIALVHSELSEALEAHRKGRHANIGLFNFDNQGSPFHAISIFQNAFTDNIKDTVEDELADAMIRILDYCGANNIDIDFHIKTKLEYNKLREYKHGKKY